MLRALNEVLDRMKQGPSQNPQRVETSETSGDETDTSKGCRIILSKKIFGKNKVYEANELARFFVIEPSDAAIMPCYFCCRVCRKKVSVLTHRHHEVLRHFPGSGHFATDQRLRLETPGWCVLVFHGYPVSEDKLERQKGKIKRGPFVAPDREHPFVEDLITIEAGVVDPQFPVLTKLSSLVDALRLRGSNELVWKLWAQFVLNTGPVNAEVAWTHHEVLIGSVNFCKSFPVYIVVLLVVNHFNWNATPKSVTLGWLG